MTCPTCATTAAELAHARGLLATQQAAYSALRAVTVELLHAARALAAGRPVRELVALLARGDEAVRG